MKEPCTYCWSYSTMRANKEDTQLLAERINEVTALRNATNSLTGLKTHWKYHVLMSLMNTTSNNSVYPGRGKKIPVSVPRPDLQVPRRTSLYSSDEAMMGGGEKIGEERAEGRRGKEKREEGEREGNKEGEKRKVRPLPPFWSLIGFDIWTFSLSFLLLQKLENTFQTFHSVYSSRVLTLF